MASLIRCPVGGSIGGCGARAVSRKTPIYFIRKTNYYTEKGLCIEMRWLHLDLKIWKLLIEWCFALTYLFLISWHISPALLLIVHKSKIVQQQMAVFDLIRSSTDHPHTSVTNRGDPRKSVGLQNNASSVKVILLIVDQWIKWLVVPWWVVWNTLKYFCYVQS